MNSCGLAHKGGLRREEKKGDGSVGVRHHGREKFYTHIDPKSTSRKTKKEVKNE